MCVFSSGRGRMCGGERVSGLGLGFTGTRGVRDMCLCCGCVSGVGGSGGGLGHVLGGWVVACLRVL